MTLDEIMGGEPTAEIVCPIKGEVVRRLTRLRDPHGDWIMVDAITEQVTVPASTTVVHEPWCMDRGNMLFDGMKLCTELDVIRFPSGREGRVTPRGVL
jgi:hypothetical protein